MSLRTIQRLTLASVLALGGITAAGCDDDDSNGDGDGDGNTDGSPDGNDGSPDGSDGSPGGDAGPDGGEGLICEADTEVCPPTMAIVEFPACCDDSAGAGTGTCGAEVPEAIGMALSGCFAKNQPGDESEHCAELVDALDGVLGNGGFEVMLATGAVAFPGCCTDVGLCGLAVDEVTVSGMTATLGFGCVPVSRFYDRLGGGGGDAGAPDGGEADAGAEGPALAPYCLPGAKTDDAACPPKMAVTPTVNLCDVLLENGVPVVECNPDADTPAWVCAAQNLPTITEGTVPTEFGDCLEFLNEYVRGCGIGETAAGCIPNVANDVFGCVEVTEGTVAGLPEYVCGCGDEVVGERCIPNVPVTVCGAVDITTGPIAGLPEYACGCGNGVIRAGCLPNVDVPLCGAVAHTTGDVPDVPEYACGCGEGERGTGSCIPNVGQTTCGAIEVNAGQVANIPNAVCGCGDEEIGNGTCIPNVPDGVCGAVARCPTEGVVGTGEGSATTCSETQTCTDNTGAGGTVGGGDDIGDTCAPTP